MPEKVHTRFGDAPTLQSKTPHDSPQNRQNGQISGQKFNAPFGTAKLGGTKRMRDGSPKALPISAALPTDQKSQNNLVNSKNASYKSKTTPTSTNGSCSKARGVNVMPRKGPGGSSINRKPSRSHVGLSIQEVQNLRKAAAQLESERMKLPIWTKREDIRWALREHDVLLLNGETGSGKSTQVPQFLYTEPWCKKCVVKVKNKDGKMEEISVGGMIAITQPRRVAAMTLAHRVAREMGSPLSKGARGHVGYSVRFDSVVPSDAKIKFVTEGMLLQELLHDPDLRKYSAVIVDEIHERSVDVDLLAGFLREILHGDKKGRGGIPLKIVVMSATLDLGGIEAFFAKPSSQSKYQPGNNHGKVLAAHMLEYEVDGELESHPSQERSEECFPHWNGIRDSGDKSRIPSPTFEKALPAPCMSGSNPVSLKNSPSSSSRSSQEDVSDSEAHPGISQSGVAIEYVRGRQHGVDIIYEVNPAPDYLQSMLQIILQLHVKEALPGDILAFLTGQEEIESLQKELEKYAEQLVKTLPRMKVMPLYGSLPAQAQQDVFEKVKEKFTRKIVLATNIAETSVTVSGVRFVVDCGKAKVKQYRPRLGLESLLAKPISRVSAIQRAGRAGREAKGKCFRVYTEQDYLKLEQDDLPEILRCDVIEAVLKMKARGVSDVLAFPLMDSPNQLSMESALVQLHMMGALDDHGHLTAAGLNMANYPLPAAYGRVLTAAAEPELNVLLEVIDIVSCLTTESEVFLQPRSDEEKDEICTNRCDIIDRQSDIITLLKTMQQYAAENINRGDWCRRRGISVRAMKMALGIRKQLRQLCRQQGLLKEMAPADPQRVWAISPARVQIILAAFLRAFSMKTALLAPDGSYVTTVGRNQIAIHPSSVLFGKKTEAIMFLDHVFTAKSYAKKVSIVQGNWIEEALLNYTRKIL